MCGNLFGKLIRWYRWRCEGEEGARERAAVWAYYYFFLRFRGGIICTWTSMWGEKTGVSCGGVFLWDGSPKVVGSVGGCRVVLGGHVEAHETGGMSAHG